MIGILSRCSSTTAASDKNTPLPLKQPINWPNDVKLTKVVESKEDFKHVLKLLPEEIVPEPPKHDSYPTPSGWRPPNYEKAKKLPYAVLRTRFHNFPIYVFDREGGSRKLVRIRYIQGNIWVSLSSLHSLFLTTWVQQVNWSFVLKTGIRQRSSSVH